MIKHSKEYLQTLTPYAAYELLLDGNKRFINNLQEGHDHLKQVNVTREGQYPFAVVLSCMDSRTSAELIFDQGLGDLFSVRVAGNIVNNDIIASVEYAVKHVGSKLLMVLGHTGCGAIAAAKAGIQDGHITGLVSRIQPAISKAMLADGSNHMFSDSVAYANVENSLEEILTGSDTVRAMFERGDIGIVGGVYNVENGVVDFFKNLTRRKKKEMRLVDSEAQ